MFKTSNKVILYGASGHAKVIIDSIDSSFTNIVLVDDNSEIEELFGLKVSSYNSYQNTDIPFVVSIGNNQTRRKIVETIKKDYIKVIHPNSCVSNRSEIDEGSVIFANAVIQPATIIGKHVIINTKASVDHDCVIGDFVHIAPGATVCGGVNIGEGTFVGAGAVILPNINIGNWCTIGAGSVVTKNIKDGELWYGNPAKKIVK